MDFNLFARVAKLVALFGFFLPWVTVSCADQELARATGWQLMTGQIETIAQGADAPEKADPAISVIVTFAVVVLGLALGIFLRGRTAAIAMLSSAVVATGLAFYSLERMRSELAAEIADSQREAGTQGSMFNTDQLARMIQVEDERGFWVTILALGAAAILSLLVVAQRAAPLPPADPAP